MVDHQRTVVEHGAKDGARSPVRTKRKRRASGNRTVAGVAVGPGQGGGAAQHGEAAGAADDTREGASRIGQTQRSSTKAHGTSAGQARDRYRGRGGRDVEGRPAGNRDTRRGGDAARARQRQRAGVDIGGAGVAVHSGKGNRADGRLGQGTRPAQRAVDGAGLHVEAGVGIDLAVGSKRAAGQLVGANSDGPVSDGARRLDQAGLGLAGAAQVKAAARNGGGTAGRPQGARARQGKNAVGDEGAAGVAVGARQQQRARAGLDDIARACRIVGDRTGDLGDGAAGNIDDRIAGDSHRIADHGAARDGQPGCHRRSADQRKRAGAQRGSVLDLQGRAGLHGGATAVRIHAGERNYAAAVAVDDGQVAGCAAIIGEGAGEGRGRAVRVDEPAIVRNGKVAGIIRSAEGTAVEPTGRYRTQPRNRITGGSDDVGDGGGIAAGGHRAARRAACGHTGVRRLDLVGERIEIDVAVMAACIAVVRDQLDGVVMADGGRHVLDDPARIERVGARKRRQVGVADRSIVVNVLDDRIAGGVGDDDLEAAGVGRRMPRRHDRRPCEIEIGGIIAAHTLRDRVDAEIVIRIVDANSIIARIDHRQPGQRIGALRHHSDRIGRAGDSRGDRTAVPIATSRGPARKVAGLETAVHHIGSQRHIRGQERARNRQNSKCAARIFEDFHEFP